MAKQQFSLKPIARSSIPRALQKAERYRLLNEAREAESICRDILATDPENQEAAVCLILALSDRFPSTQTEADEARSLAAALRSEHDRAYYAGVIEERWAKAMLRLHDCMSAAYASLREAMTLFEKAESLASDDNDDATLRWNTCVRLLEKADYTPPADESEHVEIIDEDMPMR
ncbi:MAG: hypothetical protein EA376_14725 [Phycisphaeraceae bacterium]|nr:MAG: hypothetical protein EA376_14725 [Phycisphaeraceae bacterium]